MTGDVMPRDAVGDKSNGEQATIAIVGGNEVASGGRVGGSVGDMSCDDESFLSADVDATAVAVVGIFSCHECRWAVPSVTGRGGGLSCHELRW